MNRRLKRRGLLEMWNFKVLWEATLHVSMAN
jgi:hypothetical protein